MRSIQARDHITDQQHSLQVEGKPDTCPRCHHAVDAKELATAAVNGNPTERGTALEIVYRCPRQKCAKFFIAAYYKPVVAGRVLRDQFELQWVGPETPKEPFVTPEVEEVSPTFKTIYTQAAAAESFGLDQIAGVGLRKSLEFLIKDYCIQQTPQDEEAIRREFLGNAISNRVSDPNVKQCALRATWLGNDETHYERRWVGQDIADMKILIELTMSWIRSDVLTKCYLATMPDPKKTPTPPA